MAKATGPLMSIDARGGFAGAMVFSNWKGRPTVRQLVIPANPQSQDQMDARNAVRVTGAAQNWVNFSLMLAPAQLERDKLRIMDITPATFAWNGFLTDRMIGPGSEFMDAGDALYTALTAAEKTAWVNAATALVPAFTSIPQYDAGGVLGTPKTAGNVFFNYIYGLFKMGLSTVPGAVPPVYT